MTELLHEQTLKKITIKCGVVNMIIDKSDKILEKMRKNPEIKRAVMFATQGNALILKAVMEGFFGATYAGFALMNLRRATINEGWSGYYKHIIENDIGMSERQARRYSQLANHIKSNSEALKDLDLEQILLQLNKKDFLENVINEVREMFPYLQQADFYKAVLPPPPEDKPEQEQPKQLPMKMSKEEIAYDKAGNFAIKSLMWADWRESKNLLKYVNQDKLIALRDKTAENLEEIERVINARVEDTKWKAEEDKFPDHYGVPYNPYDNLDQD